MTLAVLPLTACVYGLLFHRQWRDVFRPLGLKVRKNWVALVASLFVYQIHTSAVSVRGYAQELFGRSRRGSDTGREKGGNHPPTLNRSPPRRRPGVPGAGQ